MNLARRLLLAFLLLVVITAGLALLIRAGNDAAEQGYREFVERTEPMAAQMRALERAFLRAAVAVRSYLAFPEDSYRRRLDEAVARTRESLTSVLAATRGSPIAQQAAQLPPMVEAYFHRAEQLIAGDLSGTASDLEQRLSRDRDRLVDAMAEMLTTLERGTRESLSGIESRLAWSKKLSMWGVLITLGLFVALGLMVIGSIRRPTRELVKAIGDWRQGKDERVRQLAERNQNGRSDEIAQIAAAFSAAATTIRLREQRQQADNRLCQHMVTHVRAQPLVEQALADAVVQLGAVAGLLYRWDAENEQLVAMTSHAIKPASSTLALGEGLPGEAARQRRRLHAADVPSSEALQLDLGYQRVATHDAVAVPLQFGDDLLGVMVIASLSSFDDEHLAYLDAAARLISVGLRNAMTHERVVTLLDEARDRNVRLQEAHETLQAQNEEIQAQNEEIQAQHEELQAQNEEIQIQHEEMQAQNEQLAELTHDLRRRAEESAESDQRKTDFISVLAHELRNPMAPIVTSLALLRRVPGDSVQANAAISALERQTRHLTRLIEDLLDLTRIARGKVELQRKAVDLVTLTTGCASDYREAIEAKAVELLLRMPDEPVWVTADRDRIIQAVGNLIHNAMKFTPPGGRITVALISQDGQAELSIIDTGAGIDADLQMRLFEPFSQGPTGLDRASGGLGLGLALVRGLVEQHGGSAFVESAGIGHGSRFVIRLPTCAPPLEPALPDTNTASSPVGEGGAPRVLVVDDNIDAASTLRMALEWEGCEVAIAHDGVTAVEMAASFQPALILCDIGLPGLDGYEVARRIRAQPPAGIAPVLIALTGYASPQDQFKVAEAGFVLHLAKPVEFGDLINAVRGALATHSTSSRDASADAADDAAESEPDQA